MPHQKGQRTRLDPSVRRNQIVEAAAETFRRRGPEVTFEDIACSAGVSRALVYNYFGDRAGLLAAVYLHAFGELTRRLAATLTTSGDPAERMRAVVDAHVRFACDHADTWRVLQLTATDHPAVRSARSEHVARLASTWGDTHLARVVASGVLSMLESATSEWLDGSDLDADEIADTLYQLLWTGASTLTPAGG